MLGSESNTRKLTCWIESFVENTDGIPSPALFRKWSAIATIGGALERRVWTQTSMSAMYANMFILLVAPPGVGKTQAVRPAVDLWQKTRMLKVAPDDVTKASLLDHMAEAHQAKVYSATEYIEYHSLLIGADEFGVLVPAHDLSFMSTMNALYDNRDVYKESRRGREGDLLLTNPQVTLLAGTQPDFLASMLPPEAWGMGFMSRMIMVYAGSSPKPKLFGKRLKVELTELTLDLKIISDLHGEMDWTEAAQTRIVTWYEGGMLPVPGHSKLKHYLPRRILNVIKLSMISSVSRGNDLIIDEVDVSRAIDWLVEVEAIMPDIFKDMSGASDSQIIQDMHYYVYEIHTREKKPIHRSRVEMFLQARTPAYNVEHIIKLCVRAKILLEAGVDQYNPGSMNSTGEF